MINPIGYFRLWRELMTKPIWLESTPEQCKILITLLSMANFNGKEWEWKGESYKAERGQFVTSLESIVKNSGNGVSIRNVRTALEKFEKYGFLTNQSTNKNRLITIVNWEVYQQSEGEPTKQPTSNRQATDKQPTTREEGKERKNKNIEAYTQDFEEFYSKYPHPKNKMQTFKNWKNVLINNTKDEIMLSVINYINDNKDTEKQFLKYSSNYLGQDATYLDYLKKVEEKPKANWRDSIVIVETYL